MPETKANTAAHQGQLRQYVKRSLLIGGVALGARWGRPHFMGLFCPETAGLGLFGLLVVSPEVLVSLSGLTVAFGIGAEGLPVLDQVVQEVPAVPPVRGKVGRVPPAAIFLSGTGAMNDLIHVVPVGGHVEPAGAHPA